MDESSPDKPEPTVEPDSAEPDAAEVEAELARYTAEHAAEIAAEEGKPFELVGEKLEESEPVAEAPPADAPPAAAAPASAGIAALALKQAREKEGLERLSTIQKIARLTVGERVQLAMRGSKDERFVLIRDGSKVVATAVLDSPKVSESEVEMYASMKNVQEQVLRHIATKRRFMKSYGVVRALVNNPRCPLDVALTLIKKLMLQDLKALSVNKNIADTIRKVAAKQFLEKTSGGRR